MFTSSLAQREMTLTFRPVSSFPIFQRDVDWKWLCQNSRKREVSVSASSCSRLVSCPGQTSSRTGPDGILRCPRRPSDSSQ